MFDIATVCYIEVRSRTQDFALEVLMTTLNVRNGLLAHHKSIKDAIDKISKTDDLELASEKDHSGLLTPPDEETLATHDAILHSTRALIADLCQQFDGGHPG